MLFEEGKPFSFGDFQQHLLPEPNFRTSLQTHRLELGGNTTQIAAGTAHSLFLTSNTQVYAVGNNIAGQLGLNNTIQQIIPKLVTSLLIYNVTMVSAGGFHSIFLTSGNQVLTTGANADGQLGVGDTNDRSLPELLGLFNVIQASAGASHSLFVTTSKEAWSTGNNLNGELGHGDNVAVIAPQKITALSNIVAISAGAGFSLFLNANGLVHSCGINDFGNLGLGDIISRNVPVLINTLINIAQISAGSSHSLFLNQSGFVYSSGQNSGGQLGIGSTISTNTPLLVSSTTNFSAISAGSDFSYFLGDNRVHSCGRNTQGQLGIGSRTDQTTPTLVNSLGSNVVRISSGGSYVIMLNSCPSGSSGVTCSFPICYGSSGENTQTTCSGFGTCQFDGNCTCQSGTIGNLCQITPFYWKSLSGLWSDPNNWYALRGSTPVAIFAAPTLDINAVYLSAPGSFGIEFTWDNITLNIFSIGGVRSTPDLTFSSKNITISSLFEVIKGSKITSTHSNFQILGTSTIEGDTTWSNVQFQGNLQVKPGGKMMVTNSNFGLTRASTIEGETSWTNSFVQGDLKISSTGSFTLSSSRITSSNVQVFGQMTIDSATLVKSHVTVESGGVLNLIGSNPNLFDTSPLIVKTGGIVNHITSGMVEFLPPTSATSIDNSGLYLVQTNGQSSVLKAPGFLNNGNLTILGSGSMTFFEKYTQATDGSLNLYNSTLISSNHNMTLSFGSADLWGTVITPSFIFATGFQPMFVQRGPLKIVGDFTLTEPATMILVQTISTGVINTTGSMNLQGLTLVKFPNFSPEIRSRHLLAVSSVLSFQKLNVYLMGTPLLNAQLESDGFGQLFIFVDFLFGSLSNPGYQCGYIGNQKSLEMNIFGKQNKIVLSLTGPIRGNSWIGFGFDVNNKSLDTAVLVWARSSEIVTFQGQAPLMDISSVESKNLFNIGPLYHTITLFLPIEYLAGQNSLYYFVSSSNATNFNRSEIVMSDLIPFRILSGNKTVITPEQNCTNFLQPSRAEIYSIPGTVILLIIYLFLFVLCCILVFYRPMNTRGLSPHLTLLFLFIQLILEIRNYSEIPSFQGSLCLYYGYGVFPLQEICFVMILLYFVRYFAIINLNDGKKTLYQQILDKKNVELSQKIRTRFLKLIASSWFTYILVVVSYVSIIIVYTIVLASWKYICQFETLTTLKIIHNSILIFVYIATILTFILDMIPNGYLIVTFRWVQYIFYNDPYYFRVQIILFVPFMLYSLAIELWGLIDGYNFYGIVKNFQTVIILNTISFNILLVIGVCFPIVVTILDIIAILVKKCMKKRGNGMDDVINNPELLAMFTDFCEKEFSIENLSFYQEVQNFKKTKYDPLGIYYRYLNGSNSVMEINVPKQLCQILVDRLKNNDIQENIFDDLERASLSNLSDTYSRFVFTRQYEKYMFDKKNEIELLEGK